MKKYLIALIALLAVGSVSASDIKEIRFGVDPTFAPFESKDQNGHVVGFDIDLGNAICEKLQAKCVWVETNFDGIIAALQARKFDAILSGMFVTEKRKEQIAFSDKLYTGPVFLVAGKNTLTAASVEQLKGKTIGVEQGSAQETYANKYWRSAGVNIVSYQGSESVLQDLQSGRINGAILPGVVAEYGFLKKPQGQNFALIGDALQDKDLFGGGAAIGVRKDDAALREAINSAMRQILADGTYKKLADKYFSFDIYAGV